MHMNQWLQRYSTLVLDSNSDVVGIHLHEMRGHLLERRRPPRIDPRPQSGSPREQDQISVIRVVV